MWWHTVTHWRGKWRGNWWLEWVAGTLHTTSEHGVSSITTADAHTSAASSRLNWRPWRFKWTRPFRQKIKSGFCACDITFETQFTISTFGRKSYNMYTFSAVLLTVERSLNKQQMSGDIKQQDCISWFLVVVLKILPYATTQFATTYVKYESIRVSCFILFLCNRKEFPTIVFYEERKTNKMQQLDVYY